MNDTSILDPHMPRIINGKVSTFAQRALAAATFHTRMAKAFRQCGNEADAKRADQFAADWQMKADSK